jgi:nucleotide-binding universal stress UspA family protein
VPRSLPAVPRVDDVVAPSPFRRIVCGVDGGRSSLVAVRQTLALAAPDGAVRFVAVAHIGGFGDDRRHPLSPERADAALAEAAGMAAAAGLSAAVERIDDLEPARRLLGRARTHDLLVVGADGPTRARGLALGEVPGVAVHRAAVPVLLARPPGAAGFPARIVVASAAEPADRPVVRIAAQLARRHHAPLIVLHAHEGCSPAERQELALQATDAAEITRNEPVVLSEWGRAVPWIVEVAGDRDGTLLVCGSGGRRVARALGSVSERVASAAPSSVLVLRPSRPAS